MLFIISLSIVTAAVILLDKPLKKQPSVFYVAAAVLTAFSIVIDHSDIAVSSFVKDNVLAIFTRGALGAALWAVVMWTGALPNGSAAIKKLMPIRGELSITAAIITFSHIVTYGVQYITDIARNRTGSGDAFRDFVITSIVCLIMVLIMTPLTIMSFKTLRKKMNAKTWKKIQRSAYIFYALIYVHIMVLFVPKAQKGREGYFLSILVYSAMFIGYAVIRIRKAYIVKRKPDSKNAANIVCACAIIGPLCLIGFISRNTGHSETIKATVENPATFTFDTPVSQTATAITTVLVSDTTSAATTTITTSAEPVSTSVSETTALPETSSSTVTTESVTETVTETTTAAMTTEPVTTTILTEPTYRLKNGTFEGTGEGYSGTVHVSITIENDYITAFSAYADDDDPDYFSDAMQHVIPQIQRSLSADGLDACSGATYSSKGIIEAAKKALEKAVSD